MRSFTFLVPKGVDARSMSPDELVDLAKQHGWTTTGTLPLEFDGPATADSADTRFASAKKPAKTPRKAAVTATAEPAKTPPRGKAKGKAAATTPAKPAAKKAATPRKTPAKDPAADKSEATTTATTEPATAEPTPATAEPTPATVAAVRARAIRSKQKAATVASHGNDTDAKAEPAGTVVIDTAGLAAEPAPNNVTPLRRRVNGRITQVAFSDRH